MLNPNALPNFLEIDSPLPSMDTLRRAAAPVLAVAAVLTVGGCGEADPSPVCTGISAQVRADNKTGIFRISSINETTPDWKAEKYEFKFGDGSSDDEEGREYDQDGDPGGEDHKYAASSENKTYTVSAVIIMEALRENKWVQDGEKVSCPDTKITIPGTQVTPPSSSTPAVAPTTASSNAQNKRPTTTTVTTTTTRKR